MDGLPPSWVRELIRKRGGVLNVAWWLVCKYIEQRMCGCKPQAMGYGTWQGHPREHVPWFPTVADDLCDGCGACIKFCSFGIYEETPDGKVTAAELFKCQVGCSSCVRVCKPKMTILDNIRPR